ncbi:MAG: GNAT family N-acetyltransferase [Actinobacteria bacterium]|nr:GNAT family N-acetyltransferase [Actinomycetota bacterium]
MPADLITVRLAAAEDLPVLHSREAHPDAHLALRHFQRQQAGDYLFAVAEQGDVLLGFCVLDCNPESELCPELKSLWVYPEFRRLGAGRALTRYLENSARERDFVEVFLRVDPDNAAAIPMYIGLDYTPTGDHLLTSYEVVDAAGATQVTERHDAVYRKSLLAH